MGINVGDIIGMDATSMAAASTSLRVWKRSPSPAGSLSAGSCMTGCATSSMSPSKAWASSRSRTSPGRLQVCRTRLIPKSPLPNPPPPGRVRVDRGRRRRIGYRRRQGRARTQSEQRLCRGYSFSDIGRRRIPRKRQSITVSGPCVPARTIRSPERGLRSWGPLNLNHGISPPATMRQVVRRRPAMLICTSPHPRHTSDIALKRARL
jgi:hypothetical protein